MRETESRCPFPGAVVLCDSDRQRTGLIPESEEGRDSHKAKHTVKLNPFLIAKYEVTQAEYAKAMNGIKA